MAISARAAGADVAVRDAATVLLVRDADVGGVEVLMLRRNLDSAFVGGAWVFPGGAVDPVDRHAEVERFCIGRSDAEASAELGMARGGLAYWAAAVRECFEEAGVLLACDDGGELVSFDDPAVASRFDDHRRTVERGERTLVEVCTAEDLRLAVGAMASLSRWITPVGAPRRYDTRFFVAAAPTGQTPVHDAVETIAHTWITPGDALARSAQGAFELILPTQRSLEFLDRFDSAASLLAHLAERVPAQEAV